MNFPIRSIGMMRFSYLFLAGLIGTSLAQPTQAAQSLTAQTPIHQFRGGLSGELQQHIRVPKGQRSIRFPQNSSGGKVDTSCQLILSGPVKNNRVIAGVHPTTGQSSKIRFRAPVQARGTHWAIKNRESNSRIWGFECDGDPTLAELNAIFAGSIKFKAIREHAPLRQPASKRSK